MITTFQTAASSFSGQPSISGEKLILRSSQVADTTQSVTISGLVGASPDTESIALDGRLEVQGTKALKSLTSSKLSAVCTGAVQVRAQGTAGAGRIIVTTNPVNNDNLIIGLTGFTKTYIFKTTLTGAADEILIGATASATAVNIRRAIRDGNTVVGDGIGEGTLYGTGTTAHPHLDIVGFSGTILTPTDKLACSRQVAWSFTQGVGTSLSLAVPTGGVDGALLATFAVGETVKIGAAYFDDEALASLLLPANSVFVSDWIRMGGKSCTLYLGGSDVATAIAVSYETATNTAYPVPGITSLTSLDNSRYVISPAEQAIENIRLTLINTNSTAASINAKAVSR